MAAVDLAHANNIDGEILDCQVNNFSCTLSSISELPNHRDNMFLPTARLQPSAPFTCSQLAKIAPAFDPDLTTLLIVWDQTESQLSLHAIARHASIRNDFSQPPVNAPESANARPDLLTFTSKGPATIAVSRAFTLLGTIQYGNFTQASPTPFSHRSLGAHLLSFCKQDLLYKAHQADHFHLYSKSLQYLLSEASRRGHGSTIIILPPGFDLTNAPYHPKFAFSEPCSPYKVLSAALEHKNNLLLYPAYLRSAQYSIERIAQLASIDGSLILTHQLEVVCFGARLIAEESSLRAEIGPNGIGRSEGGEFDIGRYGMRHRSAFNFISNYVDTIAFVISQDGPTRAMRRFNETKVHVWPDCNTSMFLS